MRTFLSAAVGGLLLGMSVSPGYGSSTPVGGPAVSLTGWNEYCQAQPADCRIDPGEALTVPYTPRLRRLLDRINRSVNARIIQQVDREHFGVDERWTLPADGIGDCEDIQLEKRRLLVRAGLPRRALLITVVVTPQGEGHAVLTVRTSAGDFILDNKNNSVKRWDTTDLRFIKRESQDAASWVSLGTPPMTQITAAAP